MKRDKTGPEHLRSVGVEYRGDGRLLCRRSPARALWITTALVALAPCLATGVVSALELHGRVVDEAGAAISQARIELQRILPRYESGKRIAAGFVRPESAGQVKTSRDGGYRLMVPEPGMWQVEISAPGRIPVRQRLIPLLDDQELPPAKLEQDGGVWIHIEDQQGEAVAGAQVWIRPVRTEEQRVGWRDRQWEARGRFGLSDAAGNILLARRRGTPLQVFAWAEGFMPSAALAVEGERATLRLERGRPVRMRFLTASGEPAPQALVRVGEQQWSSTVTDHDGRARIFLRPGEPLAFALRLPTGQQESGTLEAEEEDLDQGPDEVEEMTLPAPVTLEGRVIDLESRSPPAAAWVWVGGDAGRVEPVDRSGRYRLVEGSSSYWQIGAAAPGYLPKTEIVQSESPAPRGPILALVRGVSFSGRVIDGAGDPVAGARVRATAEQRGPFASGEGRRATSGADGRFRLAGLAATGSFQLRVEADGFAPAQVAVRPQREAEIEIVLVAGRSVIGRLVTIDGDPVSGARVVVTPGMAAWTRGGAVPRSEPVATTSGADGSFRLDGLPREQMVVIAMRSGFAVTQVPAFDLEESTADGPPVDLGDVVMESGSEIFGVVRDEDEEPIVGVKVRVVGGSTFSMGLGGMPYAELDRGPIRTGEEGDFRLGDLMPGEEISLMFEHTDYLRHSADGVKAGGEEPLMIVLERAARLSGRVVDEGRRPVRGVRVEVRGGAPQRRELSGRFFDPTRRDSTISEEDGSFELERVPTGRVEIEAAGAGYIRGETLELTIAPGERREAVELLVRRGVELTGTVRDATHRPVVGAIVQVTERGSLGYLGRMGGATSAQSDADGVFRLQGLDPEAEALVLGVHHPEYLPYEEPLELDGGANRLDVTLRAGLSVSGRVLTRGGEAVAGAAVALDPGAGVILSGRASSMTATDGSFEIEGVGPGAYHLFAMKEGFARSSAPEPVVLTDHAVSGQLLYLSRGGTIRGRVLGLESTELVGVAVMAADGARQHASGFVGPDGEYRIPNVGFGEGTVSAMRDSGGQHVTEPFTLDTEGGETWVDLEFRSTEGSRLAGQVLLDGEPWRGVQVIARGGIDSQGAGATDGAGRFEIAGLRDGRHQLLLIGAAAVSHSEEVEVLGDTEVLVEVTSVRISGRVVDAATAEPVARAVVTAEGSSPAWLVSLGARAETSASGRFELVLPASREVTLRAKAEGRSEASLTLATGPGADIEGVVLALEPAGDLELDVRLTSGLRPSWVGVAVIDQQRRRIAGEMLTGVTEGPVRIPSVPPGDWTLLVAGDGGATISMPVRVPGPMVTVTLPPESRIAVDLSALSGEIGTAQMHILDPSGEPLAIPVAGRLFEAWPVFGAQTLVPSVPAGDWVVVVTDDGGRSWRQTVTTVSGETARVVLD